jgi:hypothetical protein
VRGHIARSFRTTGMALVAYYASHSFVFAGFFYENVDYPYVLMSHGQLTRNRFFIGF